MAEATPRFRGGEGEPILLVHSALLNWRTCWEPLLDSLSAQRDVLAPTLPGHLGGPTFTPGADSFAIDTFVDHLEAELDAAGFECPDVVGNSLGGWCALELARRGRARRVVALDPTGMYDSEQAEVLVRRFRGFHNAARRVRRFPSVAFASPQVRRRAVAVVATHGDRLPAAFIRDAITAIAACEFPALISATAASLDGPIPAFQRAEEVEVPVRLIWGDRDTLATHDQMDRYVAALPNARLLVLEGVSHCPQLDAPKRVADEILSFTARDPSGPSC